MRTADDLTHALSRIDHRGYPAYKDLRGSYDFDGDVLSIDHVQGDPFASPSQLSAHISLERCGWPGELHDQPHRRVAFEDFLLRRLARELSRASHVVGGSGKSGYLGTDRPGPEVLPRSGCDVGSDEITLRLEAGFPARGRSVDARGLERMLLDLVPSCLSAATACDARSLAEARRAVDLADDQRFVRQELDRLGLVAFVADGSVLPRESGVSSRPMRDARPFTSPESMCVTLDLPHAGPTSGMAIRRGVTLIVGGGYHGKSTLLKALQEGVYDHVAGDGRELVVTEATAWKLRAEDGRPVRDADISPFIGTLPNGQDTRHFSTLDASGSTSQAAATVEAIDAGCRTLLIDEDTSATNFMVRDRLMEAVVSREHEPITPFVERVRDLWERAGVSTVVVAGSSGSFFSVADAVVQMDRYEAHDITERAARVCHKLGAPETPRATGFPERMPGHSAPAPAVSAEGERGRSAKVRSFGCEEAQVGRGTADLRLVEQLVDPEQAATIAHMVLSAAQAGLLDGTHATPEAVGAVFARFEERGWEAVLGRGPVSCGLALPRPQELAAALARWRS